MGYTKKRTGLKQAVQPNLLKILAKIKKVPTVKK